MEKIEKFDKNESEKCETNTEGALTNDQQNAASLELTEGNGVLSGHGNVSEKKYITENMSEKENTEVVNGYCCDSN